MSHERATIRHALVATLTTGPTPAGARVFKTRRAPIRAAELPCINVYFMSEVVDEDSRGATKRSRTATFGVDFFAASAADLDDVLDAGSLAVETAMDALALADVREVALDTTEAGLVMVGEVPMGCAHHEFRVTYRVGKRAPAAGGNFETVDVTALVGTQESEHRRTDIYQGGP